MPKKKKIKVAFPHMGTISIAWAAALRKIGLEAYVPPYTSKRTLSLGTKNSPEAICLPYKLILGNFIEAIEGGADYVAMITSPGICRLGEYGNNIKNTLSELGYKANYIELSLYDGFRGLYKFLKELSGKNNPVQIIRAINICMRKIFVIDELDSVLSYYRAREINTGDAEKRYKKALQLIDAADKTSVLKKARVKETKEESERNHILYKSIEDNFQSFFGSKVRLDAGKRRGKIIIEYTSNDDLERILNLIK